MRGRNREGSRCQARTIPQKHQPTANESDTIDFTEIMVIAPQRHVATKILPALILAALAAGGCTGGQRAALPAVTARSIPPPAQGGAIQGAGAQTLRGEVQRELAAMRVTR